MNPSALSAGTQRAPAPGWRGGREGLPCGSPGPRTRLRVRDTRVGRIWLCPRRSRGMNRGVFCARRGVLGVIFPASVMGRPPSGAPGHLRGSKLCPRLLRADWGHLGFNCLKGEAVRPTDGLYACGPAALGSLYPPIAGTAPQCPSVKTGCPPGLLEVAARVV